jgi:hypothetical protein
MEKVILSQLLILAKRGHFQKWSSPYTNHFINLTLLLVEGGLPFGTSACFPLVVTGFLTGVMLFLATGFSFSIEASTNPFKFL